MEKEWHSLLLEALAFILSRVASIAPHPFDRLLAGLAQLCAFFAELTR
jgi:hypothetical protein